MKNKDGGKRGGEMRITLADGVKLVLMKTCNHQGPMG